MRSHFSTGKRENNVCRGNTGQRKILKKPLPADATSFPCRTRTNDPPFLAGIGASGRHSAAARNRSARCRKNGFSHGFRKKRHSGIGSATVPAAGKRKQDRMPPPIPFRLTLPWKFSTEPPENPRIRQRKGRTTGPSRQKRRAEIGKDFFPILPLISSLGKISVPRPEGIPCSSERRLPQEGNKVHPECRRPPESLIKAGKRRMYLVLQMGGSPPVPADGRAALLKQVPRRLRPRSPAPGPAAELLCGAGGIPGDALLTAS